MYSENNLSEVKKYILESESQKIYFEKDLLKVNKYIMKKNFSKINKYILKNVFRKSKIYSGKDVPGGYLCLFYQ